MSLKIKSYKPYAKTIVAVIIGLLQILSVYVVLIADGTFSATDQQAVIQATIIALGGSAAVYSIPNKK